MVQMDVVDCGMRESRGACACMSCAGCSGMGMPALQGRGRVTNFTTPSGYKYRQLEFTACSVRPGRLLASLKTLMRRISVARLESMPVHTIGASPDCDGAGAEAVNSNRSSVQVLTVGTCADFRAVVISMLKIRRLSVQMSSVEWLEARQAAAAYQTLQFSSSRGGCGATG